MLSRLITGAALLALAACGRSGGEADRQAAASGSVSVNATPGDITISTPNGIASIHTGSAPAAMPDGIPAYPNADPGENIDLNGGSAPGHGRILGFGTHDAPAQVIAFYAQAIAGAGYTIANRMDLGATSTITARRGDGMQVVIVATQAAGGTRVQITIVAGAG